MKTDFGTCLCGARFDPFAPCHSKPGKPKSRIVHKKRSLK